MTLRLAIDLRYAGWTGGRYYLDNLVQALGTLPENERPDVITLVPAAQPDAPAVGDPERRRTFADRAELERVLEADRIDVVFPRFGTITSHRRRRERVPRLAWIPDLQHFELPRNFSRLERVRRTVHFGRVARHAPRIVLSSRTSADAFGDRFPESRGRLRVVHFRTVPDRSWLADDAAPILERHGIEEPFLLVANQFWAHKNHATAFRALDVLAAGGEAPQLVCTGAVEDYRNPLYVRTLLDDMRSRRSAHRIVVLGEVPRAEYVQLVRAATVVVQPSLYEGWSSVVEDARVFARPLVLSDIPVHREQAPEARFFPPFDAAALAANVAATVTDADETDERAALERQTELVQAYARCFLEVAQEVVDAG